MSAVRADETPAGNAPNPYITGASLITYIYFEKGSKTMKKRILSILLAAIMVVSLLPVSVFATETPAYAESGTGKAADPYLISSVAHLNALADAVNNDKQSMSNKYFKLTKDITEPFTGTIGGKVAFSGTFDGDFHSVKLNITSDGGVYNNSGDCCYAGLFGYVNGATIKNVITTGEVYVVSTASGDGGLTFVGGVCARTSGTIQNCGNTAKIHAKSEGALLMIGGICGDNEGTIKNCYNRGDVYAHNSAVLKKTLLKPCMLHVNTSAVYAAKQQRELRYQTAIV